MTEQTVPTERVSHAAAQFDLALTMLRMAPESVVCRNLAEAAHKRLLDEGKKAAFRRALGFDQ